MEPYATDNGYQAMTWMSYIRLMRAFPDNDKTIRGLFKRGL